MVDRPRTPAYGVPSDVSDLRQDMRAAEARNDARWDRDEEDHQRIFASVDRLNVKVDALGGHVGALRHELGSTVSGLDRIASKLDAQDERAAKERDSERGFERKRYLAVMTIVGSMLVAAISAAAAILK